MEGAYVVGIIIALLVLFVSVGAIYKIRQAQKDTGTPATTTCESIFSGTCQASCTGSDKPNTNPLGKCPIEGEKCCVS